MLPNVTKCYQQTMENNGKHCLFLSQTCLCKTVVGSKSGGLEEVMERRTCFAASVAGFETVETFLEVSEPPPTALPLGLARTSIVWKRF